MFNLIESLIIFQNAVPNDMYQDRMIRVAASSIRSCSQRERGQAGKFCVISGVILNVPTEAINKTTTKKKNRSCSFWIFPVLIYIISSTFPVEMFIKIAAPVIMQLPNSNQ